MDTIDLLPLSDDPLVVVEVGVRLRRTSSSSDQKQVTLHHSCIKIEGPLELIPEQIEIDVDRLKAGEAVYSDDLPLPQGCEVIGLWFAVPIATVAGDTVTNG